MYVHTLQITSYGTTHMCFVRDVTLRARLYCSVRYTLCRTKIQVYSTKLRMCSTLYSILFIENILFALLLFCNVKWFYSFFFFVSETIIPTNNFNAFVLWYIVFLKLFINALHNVYKSFMFLNGFYSETFDNIFLSKSHSLTPIKVKL